MQGKLLHMPISRRTIFRKIGALALVISLGGAFFGMGYWQGIEAARETPFASRVKNSTLAIPVALSRSTTAGMVSAGTGAIPSDASPELKEFLQNRALFSKQMDQRREARAHERTASQDNSVLEPVDAALWKRQRELAQALSHQQGQSPLMTSTARIPSDASPELKVYLTSRNDLMREEKAFMDLHESNDPAIQLAAMEQWRQQNVARYQQLQQLAQNLSSSHPSSPAK